MPHGRSRSDLFASLAAMNEHLASVLGPVPLGSRAARLQLVARLGSR